MCNFIFMTSNVVHAKSNCDKTIKLGHPSVFKIFLYFTPISQIKNQD